MCKKKKFDRELKDKVAIIVPSLVKTHKVLQDLLQQKGRLSNDLEKVVRSTLKTFQGLTIGGINMRDRTSEWQDLVFLFVFAIAWERQTERQDTFQEAF